MTALLLALAAGLGNVIGGWAVVRPLRRSLRAIEACVAFGAGFMLGVALLGVMPEVLGALGMRGATFVLVGYMLVHLAQHVFTPHFHFGEETHRVESAAGISALLGLILHTFFDGVAIASGFHVSDTLGVLLFTGVFLHKLPEGVAMASVMIASGGSARRALGSAAILGVATVAGVLLTEQFASVSEYGLALSGGVTLYVATSNLVPEFQGKRGLRLPLAFFLGAGAFYLATRLLGH